MKKYSAVFRISWSNGFVYRLNFIMWRLRTVIQLLSIYFIWVAVLQDRTQVFGYSVAHLLTYIIGTSILRAMVYSSQSTSVQTDISSGDLSNYLLKPLNYFNYWFSRDAADKVLNILFSIVEIVLIVIILHPPLLPPSNLISAIAFSFSAIMAIIMYFFFSMIISLTVFWLPENNGWPQRFLIMTLMEFFSGSLFPLSILPSFLYQFISKLPTAYFIFIPMEIYNGRLVGSELVTNLGLMVFWIILLYILARMILKKGLTIYGAYGR